MHYIEPPYLLDYNYIVIPLPNKFVSAYFHVKGVQECLTPVQRLTYDGFAVHHYAYMVRVIQEVEPTYFEQAV